MTFDPSKMAIAQGQPGIPEQWNSLTEQIIGVAMEVHTHLGPGLRERFYELALVHELTLRGIKVSRQVPFRVFYKELDLGLQTVDTIAGDLVLLELKAAAVTPIDQAQLVGYLRFTGLPLGLLINFHVARLKEGVIRKINWPPQHQSDAVRAVPASSSVASVLPSVPSVFLDSANT